MSKTVTSRTICVFNSLSVTHEISDLEYPETFEHRLVCDGMEGEWVSYSVFAVLITDDRKFIGCNDSYQPMFPEVFEVVSPEHQMTKTVPLPPREDIEDNGDHVVARDKATD